MYEVENMKPRTLNNDFIGVSAVIGVILMVAITVAIAATVYFYFNGLPSTSNYIPKVTFINQGLSSEKILITKGDSNIKNVDYKIVVDGNRFSLDNPEQSFDAGVTIDIGQILDENNYGNAGQIYQIAITYNDLNTLATYTFQRHNPPAAPAAAPAGGYQLFVTVEITDIIQSSLTRCITFDLSDCNTGSSETINQEITFNNRIGSAVIPISFGDYTCISARDKLHTKTDR